MVPWRPEKTGVCRGFWGGYWGGWNLARGELTDAFIRTAPVGRHHDGAGYGLFLIVAPSTRKDAGGAPAGELVRSWGQRLRMGGRGPRPARHSRMAWVSWLIIRSTMS